MPKFARPTSYTGRKANQDKAGQSRFATTTEAAAGSSDELIISPATLASSIDDLAPTASTTQAGIIEIATAAEATEATSTTLAMTPALVGSVARIDTVTVSSAELLALATTPKTLVAAPGAGNFIEFLSAQLILDYNSAGYTEAGDNLGIKYTNASGVQVSQTIESTGFIDQTADTITNALPSINAIVAATGAVNQALVLDNLGSNFAAGDSDVIVKIAYRIHASGL